MSKADARTRALTVANAVLDTIRSELTKEKAPWFTDNWLEIVINQTLLTFEQACGRWKDLLGYELATGLRYKEVGGRKICQVAQVQVDGETQFNLCYGDAATIWRINLGWRRRANKEQRGFILDVERGYWQSRNQLEEDDDPDDPMSPRTQRVVPFVEDRRNCMVIEPCIDLSEKQLASFQAIVKKAIQGLYQLEDNELASEPLPSNENRKRILLYESAEGGAGVLRRLLENDKSFADLATEALRLALHLARLETQDTEPTTLQIQHAKRQIIGRCIYGVDINEMAVELCKVSLWMEALEPGKPFSFLENHIRCGNSLLGATPRLLAEGIPDEAFNPIEGDDKAVCSQLKKNNKRERTEYKSGQGYLFEPLFKLGNLSDRFAKLSAADDESLDAIADKQQEYEELIKGTPYLNARFWADTWCAAFVWKKDDTDLGRLCPTERKFREIERNPHNPQLFESFKLAKWQAEAISKMLRDSTMYPLCGRGDVNTYTVFTELNRKLIARQGRVGCIVPSGIATDDTTKYFFHDIMR